MAFCRGRLLFDEELKDDFGVSSPISRKKDSGSDGEQSTTDETPVEFDSSRMSDSSEPVPFEFELSMSPSVFKKAKGGRDGNGDSGIGSPTPRKKGARSPLRPRQHGRSSPLDSPVRLGYNDSAEEDMGSPVTKKSPVPRSRPRPNFAAIQEEERMLGSPLKPSPLTPPSKRFRSLCLYDTPHTPKSLVAKAQSRIARTASRSSRSSTGSNKSLLDPEGPQANVNPFTPTDSPTFTNSFDRLKSGHRKGLKRSRCVYLIATDLC